MFGREIRITIPQDIFAALNESESELRIKIRLFLAVQFYQREKLTIGKAAQLAGMSKYDFETFLSEHQIPISLLDENDILNDLKMLN